MRPGRSSPIFRTAESVFFRSRDFAIATRFSAALRARLRFLLPRVTPFGRDTDSTGYPPFARPRPWNIDVRLEVTDIHFSEPGAAFRLLQRATTYEHTLSKRLIQVRERNRGPFRRFAIELADGGDEPRATRLSPFAAWAEGIRAKALAGGELPSSIASPRAPVSPVRHGEGAGDSSPPWRIGLGPLPPPPREGRRLPMNRGAFHRFGTATRSKLPPVRLAFAHRGTALFHAAPHFRD